MTPDIEKDEWRRTCDYCKRVSATINERFYHEFNECRPAFLADKQPSADFDKRLADALGLVPCDSWSIFHAGAGTFTKGECDHANDKCYPVQIGAPQFSRNESVAIQLLKKLVRNDMGWNFSITLTDGTCDIYANAGDSNCDRSQTQEYNPKDGHGYSSVETECETKEFAHAVALIAWRIAQVKPGAKR